MVVVPAAACCGVNTLNDAIGDRHLAGLLAELVSRAPLLTTGADDPVLVACSGGPDSVGLLALAVHAGCDVTAAYIDHGLREASADDLQVVAAAAAMLGCRLVSTKVAIDPTANVEARARDARYAALEDLRVRLGASRVLVGHTLDDQAETVLMAVLRGSGIAGLSGMPAIRGNIVRPLLDIRRSELRTLCAALPVATVDDPMNHDERFMRVWVRETLLPMLAARSERDVAPVLARQASLVRDDHEFLDTLAADALAASGAPPRAADLSQLPLPLLRRAVRLLVGHPRIGGKQVELALGVVHGDRVALELPGLRTLRRSGGLLFVERTEQIAVARLEPD